MASTGDPRVLSGAAWVARFPGSADPSACVEPFRTGLQGFLAALRAAGATVNIAATFRPPERAYLMHWSWQIDRNTVDPSTVPGMAGVAIDWVHRDAGDQPDIPKSRSAAKQMVNGYQLEVQPALASRHTQGRAIDMNVQWTGNLTIATNGGPPRNIASVPRTGLNPDLQQVAVGYGVIKAVFRDDPHWSDDGH